MKWCPQHDLLRGSRAASVIASAIPYADASRHKSQTRPQCLKVCRKSLQPAMATDPAVLAALTAIQEQLAYLTSTVECLRTRISPLLLPSSSAEPHDPANAPPAITAATTNGAGAAASPRAAAPLLRNAAAPDVLLLPEDDSMVDGEGGVPALEAAPTNAQRFDDTFDEAGAQRVAAPAVQAAAGAPIGPVSHASQPRAARRLRLAPIGAAAQTAPAQVPAGNDAEAVTEDRNSGFDSVLKSVGPPLNEAEDFIVAAIPRRQPGGCCDLFPWLPYLQQFWLACSLLLCCNSRSTSSCPSLCLPFPGCSAAPLPLA